MKKTLTILLSLLAIAYSPSMLAQKAPSFVGSGVALEKGVALYDSDAYAQAIQVLDSIDRNDTNYVKALYNIGRCYYADSQFDKSIYFNLQALDASASDPEQVPDILNQYGRSVDAAGGTERALRIFDSAAAKYPAYSLFYVNKASMLMKLNRDKDAEMTLQQGLLIDPFSYSSYFRLGMVALKEGKLIPAMFCFVGYLLNNPQGNYHNDCISYLKSIANNTDYIQGLVYSRKEQPSGAYQMLEQIVQSKIALDEKYKPLVQPDDPILRQIQVVLEKLEYDPADSDFYMQYFVPCFKASWDRQQFETFINRAFYAVDVPELNAFRKKNKKALEAFVDTLSVYLSHIRETRILNLAGRDTATTFWAYSHGDLTAHGKYLMQERHRAGVWDLYYSAGNIRGTGNYNDKGNEDGWWTYYYFNRSIRSKIKYVNGNRDGVCTFYFDDGTISSKSTYRDGLLDGEETSNYPVGTPKQQTNYRADKEDGIKYFFFDNGDTSSMETWSNGQVNGPGQTWYQNGRVEKQYQFVNGKAEGPYVKYFDNGKMENQGNYVKGEFDGVWKTYYSDGRLHEEQNYSNGKQEGMYKEYNDSGITIQTISYRRGKPDGDSRYIDDDGKLYAIFQYSNGVLQHATYFDKTGKTIDDAIRSQNLIRLTTHYPDGAKKMQAMFNANDNVAGTKTSFYPSGQIQETEEYLDGQQEGPTILYYSDGTKKDQSRYSGGKLNGLRTTYYANGQVREQGYYQDDALCGSWAFYSDLGLLTDRKFFTDGVLTGREEEFWPNGQRSTQYIYEQGWLIEMIQYDSIGKQLNDILFPQGTGNVDMVYLDRKPYVHGRYVRGKLDGPYKLDYPDGKTLVEETYVKGILDGFFRNYFHSGKLRFEGQYNRGGKTGLWKYYFRSGKLKNSEEWVNGKRTGKEIEYYHTGEVEYLREYKDDVKTGATTMFDPDGTLMYEIIYKNDIPVGYSYLDKNGVRMPPIPIIGQAAKIKTFYPNGKVATEMEYKDGVLCGAVRQYYDNGQLMASYSLNAGNLTGEYLTYSKSGQPVGEYNYFNDNVHGPYKEYNEKGGVAEAGTYYLGAPHGLVVEFDDRGAPTETTTFYYGNIISIK